MADDGSSVKITGLRELAGAFRKMDGAIVDGVKAGFKQLAEGVAVTARAKMPSRSGRAASSYKARGSAKGASIAFGGSRAPYAPWLDFGGSVGRGHRPGVADSGAIKRDRVPGGRYLYPAIGEHKDETIETADDIIKDAARKASFDTRGAL